MTAAIIGTGLIGGSMAYALRNSGLVNKIIGIDDSPAHCEQALALGIVDAIETLENGVAKADIIILAIPVNAIEKLLPKVLNIVDRQVVFDVGSTKKDILDAVKLHGKRSRYVATHPMWGTENHGPQAATRNAFGGRAAVICNAAESDDDAVNLVENIYRKLNMHLVYMNAAEHDIHVAYISHISHITSFALANTVLQKEKEEQTIFNLASGGFTTTVRLAKSNAAMWVPIFMQNKKNVLDVLDEHLYQLQQFKNALISSDDVSLTTLIDKANTIRKIIK